MYYAINYEHIMQSLDKLFDTDRLYDCEDKHNTVAAAMYKSRELKDHKHEMDKRENELEILRKKFIKAVNESDDIQNLDIQNLDKIDTDIRVTKQSYHEAFTRDEHETQAANNAAYNDAKADGLSDDEANAAAHAAADAVHARNKGELDRLLEHLDALHGSRKAAAVFIQAETNSELLHLENLIESKTEEYGQYHQQYSDMISASNS